MDPRMQQLRQYVADFERCENLDQVPAALGLANGIKNWISTADIFSKNEEEEDVNTECLQYFLVDYYHAELHLKGQENRRESLNFAEACFDDFLERLKMYRILSKAHEKMWKEPREPSRDEKVAQFKEMKVIEKKIEVLTQRGEDPRDLCLTLVQQAIAKTLGHLKFITLELQMLEMRDSGYKLPPPPEPKPIQTVKIDASNIDKMPNVITGVEQLKQIDQRQRIAEGVFKPGYNMPTMTLEEFGDMEYKDAMEREARMKEIEGEPEDSDSDKEEVSERKRIKAAAWDDWKDENEKGSGNRNGR